MTREQLQSAGAALYGPRWQSELARALNINPRVMRFWVSGERTIPTFVKDQLEQLAESRCNEIKAIVQGVDEPNER